MYYLFDRHWTLPDYGWRHLVDDFAAAFGISRYSQLECLIFYLLDDHTEDALKVRNAAFFRGCKNLKKNPG